MPLETFEEVKDGGSHLKPHLVFAWAWDDANKAAMLLDEEVAAGLARWVVEEGYAADLTDEVEQVGRDPFPITCAVASPAERCAVTTEVSAPGKRRQKRRVPDVCASLGVTCRDTFAMLRARCFSTRWQR
jgi:hypothetical protein